MATILKLGASELAPWLKTRFLGKILALQSQIAARNPVSKKNLGFAIADRSQKPGF